MTFDPDGSQPLLQYFAVIVLGLTAIGGVVAFSVKRRAYRAAIGLPPDASLG